MSIAFINYTQELTYRKVTDYLTTSDLFKNNLQVADNEPKFDLVYGSSRVGIRVIVWEVNPWDMPELVIVRACSCLTVGSDITPELTEYLLRENLRMRFGAFQLGDQNEIFFAHNILGGEHLDLMELQTGILAVVTIADTYDEILTERFGGSRATDSHDTAGKSINSAI
jgi:glutaredoxin-related protein